MIAVKIPKDVLDLFPMWQYICPNCPDSKVLSEKVHHCVKCGAEFNDEKWRVPPRFLKNSKAMSDYAHKVLAPKLSPEQRELLFKYFTVLFSDGFESGDFSAWTTVGSPSIVTDPVVRGNYAARFPADSNVYHTFGSRDEVYERAYVSVSTLPTIEGASRRLLNIQTIAASIFCAASLSYVSGAVRWKFSAFGAIGWAENTYSTTPLPKTNTYFCLEIWWKRNTLNGAKLWVNGALKCTVDDTTSGDMPGRVVVGPEYGVNYSPTVDVDCVVVADTYIGPVEPETQKLTITSTEGGTTYPSPGSYSYAKDSSKKVTAIPDSGYVFDHWELNDINVSTELSYTVTMNIDHRLRAFFVLSEEGTLSLRALADSEEVTAFVKVVNATTGEVIDTYETEYDLDLPPGKYSLSASYKDQVRTDTVQITAGVTSTVTFRFTKMHTLTIVSDPSPIDFTFDMESVVTPFERPVKTGTYTIEMPASLMVGVDKYLFLQWEDGSVNPTRTVTIGSPQAVNLTATYRLKQIEGTGPITQREHKDNLKQVLGNEKDIDEDNPLPVKEQTPTTIYNNQITLEATAIPLSTESVPIKSVSIENAPANDVVYVGNAGVDATNGRRLWGGATIDKNIDNLNKVYVLGTVGQVISYEAVN